MIIDRLAKSICNQIKERLKQSHDTFASALKQLESRHGSRMEKTEEQRMKVRKVYAPRVARLALETTSLKDMILFGRPLLLANGKIGKLIKQQIRKYVLKGSVIDHLHSQAPELKIPVYCPQVSQ